MAQMYMGPSIEYSYTQPRTETRFYKIWWNGVAGRFSSNVERTKVACRILIGRVAPSFPQDAIQIIEEAE